MLSKQEYLNNITLVKNEYTENTLFENNLIPHFIINYNFYCIRLLISLIKDETIIFPDLENKKNYHILLNIINKGNKKIKIIEYMIKDDYIMDIYGKSIPYSFIINKKITKEYINYFSYYKKEISDKLKKGISEYIKRNLNINVICTDNGYIDENNKISYSLENELLPELIYGIRVTKIKNDFEYFINKIASGFENNNVSYININKFIFESNTKIGLLIENIKENIKLFNDLDLTLILLI